MTALVLLVLAIAQAVYCVPLGCGCGPSYPPVIDASCGCTGYGLPGTGYGYPGYGYDGYGYEGYGYGYPGYGYEGYGYGYPGYGYEGYGYEGYGYGYPGYGYDGYGYGYPGYGLEEGCCPGPVIEKKTIVEKPVTFPYAITEPTFSKKCYQRESVAREVIPKTFESAPVCETVKQVYTLPTTETSVVEQPLCKTTCTTSEYIIQIPIVETTCTSAPLCKKTVRSQDNVLTTVAKKTSCAKQVCTQNKVVEQPYTETVCQNYEGAITKAGSKTILKPEVVKSCVQLPPRKCLKPAAPGPILYGGGSLGEVDIYGTPGYYGEYPYYGGYTGGYSEEYPYYGGYTGGYLGGYTGGYSGGYTGCYPPPAPYPTPAPYGCGCL